MNLYIYIIFNPRQYIEDITRLREDMDFTFEWQEQCSVYYMDILNVVDKNIYGNNKFRSTF